MGVIVICRKSVITIHNKNVVMRYCCNTRNCNCALITCITLCGD